LAQKAVKTRLWFGRKTRISLIFLRGPMMATLRTVAPALRLVGSPDIAAGSMP
jgi:hypothetical protein